jgi:putative transcriptional regulator
MKNSKISKGTLLISEPSILTDVSFNRSVILITEHNSKGTVGFIINKPLEYTLNALVSEIQASFTVFNGGPVEQDNLYFVHTAPEIITDSVEILDGIFWGGDFDLLTQAINKGQINKNQIRFFLGYTGWAFGQLEEEIEEKSWLVVKNEYRNKIFEKSASDFWKNEILDLGGNYAIWANAPENPLMN